MSRTRTISTSPEDVACDVCGRTLLRGERWEAFLAAGARRRVCELCIARALHEGWIPESGADEVAVRTPQRERGRSLRDRLWARRERPREVPVVEDEEPVFEEAAPAPPSAGEASAPAPRRPRHVRAVPTNAELKVQRALEVFNRSEHVRTVGGVSRSLGLPIVCARPLAERPSVVAITVMWDLSWYRFEVDLSDEGSGVRRTAQGAELEELDAEERAGNAVADQRGTLSLAVAAE